MKFIIWTPLYRSDSGGIIVLHKLAKILQDSGHVALIWPKPKPLVFELKSIRGWLKLAKWLGLRLKSYIMSRDIRSPYCLTLATKRDIHDSIVVYPEIVEGNPLGASRVVRWLLNKPGIIKGSVDFGADDLFFYFHEHFNDWAINPHKDRKLNVVDLMSDVYRNYNYGSRSGQCYMTKRGRNRTLSYHDPEAEKVDGLKHEELAIVFNKYKYFVCYDLYTMYCRYAAMCGCIPIVVPEEGLTKEQWRPEIDSRYGLAYGFEDIPWALETRSKLLELLGDTELNSMDSVKKFVVITQLYFGNELREGI